MAANNTKATKLLLIRSERDNSVGTQYSGASAQNHMARTAVDRFISAMELIARQGGEEIMTEVQEKENKFPMLPMLLPHFANELILQLKVIFRSPTCLQYTWTEENRHR
jgi:hypothetical protein